jgi:hypothetical protein
MKEIYLSSGRRRKERKNMAAIIDRPFSEQCLTSRTDGRSKIFWDFGEKRKREGD